MDRAFISAMQHITRVLSAGHEKNFGDALTAAAKEPDDWMIAKEASPTFELGKGGEGGKGGWEKAPTSDWGSWREAPYAEKGRFKRKGAGKDKDKSKKGAMKLKCHFCEGDHYARDCPIQKKAAAAYKAGKLEMH